MMSGEYFLTKEQIREKALEQKRNQREMKKHSKIEEKMKLFEAPAGDLPEKVNKRKAKEAAKEAEAEQKKHDSSKKPDINELKKKFLKKK